MAKPGKKPAAAFDKLSIGNEMRQLDTKNRKFYQDLTPEERKKFSSYLILRWAASVESGSPDLDAYYLMATNENVNKHFFDLNRHHELQWLACTTVSPVPASRRHYWLGAKKSEGNQNKLTARLRELMPVIKQDELELMLKINTVEEITQWLSEHGMDSKEIRALLS